MAIAEFLLLPEAFATHELAIEFWMGGSTTNEMPNSAQASPNSAVNSLHRRLCTEYTRTQ